MKTCIDCGEEISRYAQRCRSCSKKGNTYATGGRPREFDARAAEATIARVARRANLSVAALKHPSRARTLSRPRYVAMVLLADQGVPGNRAAALLGRSQQRGAQMLETARRLYSTDPRFRATVDELSREGATA
jgi:hypothetical protein